MKKLIIFIIALFVQNYIVAQNPNATPLKCVSNHINNLMPPQYNPQQAAKSFYTGIDTAKAVDLAIKLKKVYDGKGLYISLNKIPDDSNYIDSLTGKHKYTIFPYKLPEIYLEKIDTNWYYSPKCYDDIFKLYNEVFPLGDNLFANNLPHFGNKKFAGLYLWQLLGLLIITILALILYFILIKLLKPIIILITDRSFKTHLDLPRRYNKTARIISLLVVFFLLKYAIALLELPVKLSSFAIVTIEIVNIVLIAVLVYRIFDIIMAYAEHFARNTNSKMDDQILPIIQQIVKILIIAGAVIKILILLDINVTALIAGISIGGLALALAAQDTVKNLIGSLMIFIDKPFQIEDWIEIDDMAGTVIEVGFRSTRIMKLDTSIISIPNGIISNKALTNKGLRVFRLFETTLGITYDTPIDKIKLFVEKLRLLATDHNDISENYYIFLKNLGDYSINIMFRVFLKTNDYKEELRLKEEITFLIMELAKQLEIDFAFPTQTVHIAKNE